MALSMVGGTDVCSFLNFSKAFLLISSFCTGSEDVTGLLAHNNPVSHSMQVNNRILIPEYFAIVEDNSIRVRIVAEFKIRFLNRPKSASIVAVCS